MRTSENQYSTGNITASATTPYVVERLTVIKPNYRFPAVQVIKFISDELDGRWRLAVLGIDYNLEFFGNGTMRLEFYFSGSYKVNY